MRPQVRRTYASKYAYLKASNGTIVAYWNPIYLPSATSTCQTLASCAGLADEVKTTIDYGPQVNGTANNLLPVSISSGSGNGTITATVSSTYDSLADKTYVDGPLAGTADTTRILYDAVRQVTGQIGPDPDGPGAGTLPNRASRLSYNLDGQVTKLESGTTVGQTDPAWAAFSPADFVETTYDPSGRLSTETLKHGATSYALTQYSYNNVGLPECAATRMNPAVYGSLPASACSLSTEGIDGKDRIVKAVYNAAGEVIENRVAVGVIGEEAVERTMTYTNNGGLQTVTDSENNLTTYEFDGHDRLTKARFPNLPKGSGTSSTTDYEQLGYDAASNVTSFRNRGYSSNPTQSEILFTYDNLNRRTLKNLPPGELDVTYAYDNLGRLTSASQTGNTLSFSYDALSRQLAESGPLGVVNQQFDLAGRRTNLWMAGGYCVQYPRLVTGEMSAILDCSASPVTLASFTYDNLGRRTAVSRIHGTSTAYAYDPVSRLSSLTQNLTGSDNDLTIGSIGYNPAAQITSQERSNDTYAWTGHGSGSTASTANGLNQISAIGGGTPTYDARGNLTLDPTTGKTYSYSSENRLTSASGGVNLGYDPLGRLFEVATSSSVRRFRYATGDSGLPEVISEHNSSNSLTQAYAFGPRVDEPMMWWDVAQGWAFHTLHADERGSIVAIADSNGNAVAKNKYDEFGRPQSGNFGTFQYTGQMWLPEIGAHNYKIRNFAPHLGRFLQIDPMGYEDSPNLYVYVLNDPVNLTDPLGLQASGPEIVVCGNCGMQVAPVEVTMRPRGSVGGGASSGIGGLIGESGLEGRSVAGLDKVLKFAAWLAKKLKPKVTPKAPPKISPKIKRQMASRGWDQAAIDQAIAKGPVGSAVNRATGNPASVYGGRNGYVVVDDLTGNVVQISRRGDPTWIPDSTIIWF